MNEIDAKRREILRYRKAIHAAQRAIDELYEIYNMLQDQILDDEEKALLGLDDYMSRVRAS